MKRLLKILPLCLPLMIQVKFVDQVRQYPSFLDQFSTILQKPSRKESRLETRFESGSCVFFGANFPFLVKFFSAFIQFLKRKHSVCVFVFQFASFYRKMLPVKLPVQIAVQMGKSRPAIFRFQPIRFADSVVSSPCKTRPYNKLAY